MTPSIGMKRDARDYKVTAYNSLPIKNSYIKEKVLVLCIPSAHCLTLAC